MKNFILLFFFLFVTIPYVYSSDENNSFDWIYTDCISKSNLGVYSPFSITLSDGYLTVSSEFPNTTIQISQDDTIFIEETISTTTSGTVTIDLSDLETGKYLVTISDDWGDEWSRYLIISD